MAAGDGTYIAKKGAAYRVYFPVLDADGDLVTGAAGLDSEISKDGGTFTDCTNEATEIATSSGMYYLELTATEMNADAVCIIVKTSTSGAKTTPIVIYTAARDIDDLAFPSTSGRSIDVSTGGEVGLDWANVGSPTTVLGLSGTTVKTATDVETDTADIQSRLPAALVSGRIDASVGAMAAAVLTAAAIATDALDADALAADALDEIAARLFVVPDNKLLIGASGGVYVPVMTDKTDYYLNGAHVAAIVNQIWNELTSEARTAGSYGQLLKDKVSSPGLADDLLARAISNVEATATARSLAWLIALAQNKSTMAGNTLTVYKADGTTAWFTITFSVDAAAQPTVGVSTPAA